MIQTYATGGWGPPGCHGLAPWPCQGAAWGCLGGATFGSPFEVTAVPPTGSATSSPSTIPFVAVVALHPQSWLGQLPQQLKEWRRAIVQKKQTSSKSRKRFAFQPKIKH